jgi:DNA-binding SARP family transcriptional activator/tetratricopeptide (TPR) repeat protein
MGSSPTLAVRMLGEFQIHWGETPLAGALTPRLQSLLAYLLLHRDTALSRQQLAFHFWPDSSDRQARTNLRKALYRLRQALPALEAFVDLEGATLSWLPGAGVWLDVAEFEEKLHQAETAAMQEQPALLAATVALYRGSLLPDLYDDWVLARREQLRQRYLDALELLAEQQEAKREYAAASQTARRLLREDPLRERGYRRLMRLQALSGDVAAALHTYHQCAVLLEQELGVEPARATQAAYRQLVSQQGAAAEGAPAQGPRRYPLVGRHQSWQALLASWRAVAAGRSQVVLISGEAGIGKTRLAEELLAWAGRQGIPVLSAACFATEEQMPLAPVGDWLRAAAVQQALPSLAPRWRRELARVLPELLAAYPELEMPGPLTEPWQRQHLFLALAEAVAAAGAPLLLFLDDLHWADGSTLAWLRFLARHNREAPFLLLATLRTGEVVGNHPVLAWQHELERSVPVGRIALGRLDRPATAALASHALRVELDAAAADAVYQASEGNPLFTVELARAGLGGPAGEVPDKIRSVIEAHLERLAAPARELVGLAALIGRSFSFPLLAAASPEPDEAVVRSLDELWQRQIVREQTGPAGEGGYDFSHDQIRQVALAQLSPARRRWGHGRVAAAMERVFGGAADAAHGTIATHWEAAGDSLRAADSYVRAAQSASRLYAHEESVRNLQRALVLLPAGQQSRPELLSRLGEAQILLSRYEAATGTFTQAAAETADPVASARLLGRRVAALSGSHQFEEAQEAYRQAMVLLETVPAADRDEMWWRIWLELQFSLLDVLYFEHKGAEMQPIFAAIASPLEAYGTPRQRSQYYHFRVRIQFLSLSFQFELTEEAVALAAESLRWARQTDDEGFIAGQTFSLGFALLWAGRLEAAIDHLGEAVTQMERLGIVPNHSRSLTYLGIAYRLQGDADRLRQLLEEHAGVIAADGNPHYLGVAAAQRAWLALRDGDPAAVAQFGQAALDHWGTLDHTVYPIQWLARLPLLASALRTGEIAAAREQAQILLNQHLQRLPGPLEEALRLAGAAEDAATASDLLARACQRARRHGYL